MAKEQHIEKTFGTGWIGDPDKQFLWEAAVQIATSITPHARGESASAIAARAYDIAQGLMLERNTRQ